MKYIYLIEGYKNENYDYSNLETFSSDKKSAFAKANGFILKTNISYVTIYRLAKKLNSKLEFVKEFKKSDKI